MEGKVYHGSSHSGIKKLERRVSTHNKECVYATDNEVIALLFTNHGNGDLDYVIGVDDSGLPYIIERRPGVFEKLYNTCGYIYELDGTNFNHYDYLWRPEMISFEEEEIISERKIDNILEELQEKAKQGLIRVMRYPERLKDVPLDNSDLIEKYVRYYKNGKTNAINQLLSIYPDFKDRVEALLQEEDIEYNGPKRMK